MRRSPSRRATEAGPGGDPQCESVRKPVFLRGQGRCGMPLAMRCSRLARVNDRVIALDGDLSSSTGMAGMRKSFPDRFFNLGIAEANLVGVSAGFAANGFIPFVGSLPCFLLPNAYDQLRLQVSIAGPEREAAGQPRRYFHRPRGTDISRASRTSRWWEGSRASPSSFPATRPRWRRR